MGHEGHESRAFHLCSASTVVSKSAEIQEKGPPDEQALEQAGCASSSALLGSVSALVDSVALRAIGSWLLPLCPSQLRRWMSMKKTWTTHELSTTHVLYECWVLRVHDSD